MEPRALPSRTDQALLALSAVLPAVAAATHVPLIAEGARDEAVIRTVGLGFAGPFHALDAWLAAIFAGLPLGTRSCRAELPGLLLLGAFGGLLFTVTRGVLASVRGESRWSAVVAAVSTATVTLSFACQHEATSVGGGVLGSVLVLLSLAVATAQDFTAAAPHLTGLLVLTATYEIPTGLCAVAAVLTTVLLRRRASSVEQGVDKAGSVSWVAVAFAGLLGLAPFALAMVRAHVSPLATRVRLASLGCWGDGGVRHVAVALRDELGEVLLLVAAIGLVLGLIAKASRTRVVPVLVVAAVAGGAMLLGAAADGERWSAVALVALGAMSVFAAIAMQEAVVRVARARLPLAAASAALVVVLEASFPAMALDDALARISAGSLHAMAGWEDAALGSLASGTLILVSTPDLYQRLLASKAAGDIPGDLEVLPTFDPSNEAAARALSRDPRLVPLFRDLALAGAPQELSLSGLASQRPLAMAEGPTWARALTRHLVGKGLLSSFEAEPRGGADRKHALEAFVPVRSRLERDFGKKPDPALASMTVSLLVDRALLAAVMGEREVLLHAIDDARVFAPKEPRIAQLAFRVATAKGPLDVHDLVER